MTNITHHNRSTSAVSPTSAEVEAHLRSVAARYPRLVKLHRLGRSPEGRPLLAIQVNNPRVSDADKQHVLVVAGQHGNEESSRMVAMALLDHLLSPAGKAILKKQRIVIYPNANPDGCEADSYGNAAGVLINLDHGPDGPRTSEARAIATLFKQLQPDLYIDCHSCGYTGFGSDMVLYPLTRDYTEDDNICHAMAHDMVEAGEAAGIPQYTHSLVWWAEGDPNKETSSTLFAYRQFKSIVMLTENCEDNTGSYPPALRKKTGLAKLLAALAYGQRRDPTCAYPGYPNQRVIGQKPMSVVAVGKTAAQRRGSRVAIWRQADHFAKVRVALPQAATEKRIDIDYRGATIGPVGFQVRVTGRRRVDSVRRNDRTLRRSETNGWFSFHDHCSTHVVIVIPKLTKGCQHIDLKLK